VPGLSFCGKQPDAELWIIGEGDLRADLEKLVSDLKLSGSVRFLGQVSEADKQNCCQRVAVF